MDPVIEKVKDQDGEEFENLETRTKTLGDGCQEAIVDHRQGIFFCHLPVTPRKNGNSRGANVSYFI